MENTYTSQSTSQILDILSSSPPRGPEKLPSNAQRYDKIDVHSEAMLERKREMYLRVSLSSSLSDMPKNSKHCWRTQPYILPSFSSPKTSDPSLQNIFSRRIMANPSLNTQRKQQTPQHTHQGTKEKYEK